jgi:hypothetical protein
MRFGAKSKEDDPNNLQLVPKTDDGSDHKPYRVVEYQLETKKGDAPNQNWYVTEQTALMIPKCGSRCSRYPMYVAIPPLSFPSLFYPRKIFVRVDGTHTEKGHPPSEKPKLTEKFIIAELQRMPPAGRGFG